MFEIAVGSVKRDVVSLATAQRQTIPEAHDFPRPPNVVARLSERRTVRWREVFEKT